MSVVPGRHSGVRRPWSVLGVAAVSAALVFGTAAPGVAGPSATAAGECPFSSTLCLFSGTGFTGDRFTVSSLSPGGTCVSLVSHGWGDRARSAINTDSSSAALFLNDGCVGGPYQVPANSSISSFGSFVPKSVWVQ